MALEQERQRERTPAADAVTADNIGDHVAGVLRSAQAAAQTIRDDAQRDAAALLERAKKEAEDMRARAAVETEQQRTEAQRVLQQAGEEAAVARSNADQYAERRRREADARAAATIDEANVRAASIADAANQRHQELLSNVAVTEDRLKGLSAALRKVARELDEVVEPSADGGEASEAGAAESLEASLRARAGASTGEATTA